MLDAPLSWVFYRISVRVTVGQCPPFISLYFIFIFVSNILSKMLSSAVFVYYLQSSKEFQRICCCTSVVIRNFRQVLAEFAFEFFACCFVGTEVVSSSRKSGESFLYNLGKKIWIH